MEMKKKIYVDDTNPEIFFGETKNIVYDGLVLNSNVEITNNIDICDYIFIITKDNLEKLDQNTINNKFIIIDYSDNAFSVKDANKSNCYKYFKRSVVDKKNERIIKIGRAHV
mgnify:CR=1 FL=1